MKTEKKPMKLIAIAIVILAIIALLFNIFSGKNEAVAIVNGTSITKSEYEKEYNSVKEQLISTSQGTFNSEVAAIVKEDVLNHLITLTLLDEYSKENNLTVSEEEINQEYENRIILLGGQEAFEAYIKQYSLTEKKFKEDIKNELLLTKSVKIYSGEDKISVTEEEMRTAYDALVLEVRKSEIDQEIPPYEDVKPWFAKQLENQKVLAESQIFIEDLKNKAEIEILI